MSGMEERVNTWRKHQEKMRKRKPDIDMDALSGETDADKRRRKSERDAAIALGEEYKLNWRFSVCSQYVWCTSSTHYWNRIGSLFHLQEVLQQSQR